MFYGGKKAHHGYLKSPFCSRTQWFENNPEFQTNTKTLTNDFAYEVNNKLSNALEQVEH